MTLQNGDGHAHNAPTPIDDGVAWWTCTATASSLYAGVRPSVGVRSARPARRRPRKHTRCPVSRAKRSSRYRRRHRPRPFSMNHRTCIRPLNRG